MTKIIPIEIEHPRNCPYRTHDDDDEWLCLREYLLCKDEDSFPDWCPLIDGRKE